MTRPGWEKSPQHKQESNPESSALEPNTLTMKPTRRYTYTHTHTCTHRLRPMFQQTNYRQGTMFIRIQQVHVCEYLLEHCTISKPWESQQVSLLVINFHSYLVFGWMAVTDTYLCLNQCPCRPGCCPPLPLEQDANL